MIAERFHVEHIRELAPRLQAAQRAEFAEADEEYFAWLATAGPAVTLRAGDGAVMACAGIVEMEDGSLLWSFMAEDAGRCMVGLVRAGRRLVEVARRPIAATTPAGFAPGCRLLELLGLRHFKDDNTAATGGPEHWYVLEAA